MYMYTLLCTCIHYYVHVYMYITQCSLFIKDTIGPTLPVLNTEVSSFHRYFCIGLYQSGTILIIEVSLYHRGHTVYCIFLFSPFLPLLSILTHFRRFHLCQCGQVVVTKHLKERTNKEHHQLYIHTFLSIVSIWFLIIIIIIMIILRNITTF